MCIKVVDFGHLADIIHRRKLNKNFVNSSKTIQFVQKTLMTVH